MITIIAAVAANRAIGFENKLLYWLPNDLKAGFSFHAFRGAMTEALKESKNEKYLSDDEWCNHPDWNDAVPGDFMKIFWDRNTSKGSDSGAVIGVNANKDDEQEHGHSVIFMWYVAS